MRRILLQYLGSKVIDSELRFEYKQRPIYRPRSSKRTKKERCFYFQELLFPYNLPGSLLIGYKKGADVVGPISLFTDKTKKRKIRLNTKAFVLVDSQGMLGEKGNYLLTDPLTEQIITTSLIELLQVWDVFFPIMEDYFLNEEKYKYFDIRYLTKSEIGRLKC